MATRERGGNERHERKGERWGPIRKREMRERKDERSRRLVSRPFDSVRFLTIFSRFFGEFHRATTWKLHIGLPSPFSSKFDEVLTLYSEERWDGSDSAINGDSLILQVAPPTTTHSQLSLNLGTRSKQV